MVDSRLDREIRRALRAFHVVAIAGGVVSAFGAATRGEWWMAGVAVAAAATIARWR